MHSDPKRGLLLIDKDPGSSSFHVIAGLRRLLGMKKIGHAGTLDPFASGLLIVAFGKATTLLTDLLGLDKVYRVTIRLGEQTDSGDVEGRCIQKVAIKPDDFSSEALQRAAAKLVGQQEQMPPMYSALKVDGKRLYEYAREGKKVARKARRIDVYQARYVSSVALSSVVDVDLELAVSSGTYVRTLAEQFGESLGVPAHAQALRRVAIGPYHVDDAHRLEPWFSRLNEMNRDSERFYQSLLAAGDVISLRQGYGELPVFSLTADEAKKAINGQTITVAASRFLSSVTTGTRIWLDYNGRDVALGLVSSWEDQVEIKVVKVWCQYADLCEFA